MNFDEASGTSEETNHMDIWERGFQTERTAEPYTQNVLLIQGT